MLKRNILVLFLFMILTGIFLFPIIAGINMRCPAFSSSDELLAPIWHYWYMQFASRNSLDSSFTFLLAYPFGVRVMDISSYLYLGFTHFLSLFLSYIAVYNAQIIINFLLTGFFTYLLVYRLTASPLAGLLSGIIFTFCPQHFMRFWQHITLSYFQWIPLYILFLFALKDKPGLKIAIFCAIALFLVASFDLHYLFFMSVATIVFVIMIFTSRERGGKGQFIKYLILSGFIAFLAIIAQFHRYLFMIITQNAGAASAQNVLKRPFVDLFQQSARPLSYFLPSTEHPLFGGISRSFIGSSLYGVSFTEHNLYLGLVALILAFLGYRHYRAVKKNQGKGSFSVAFFLVLAAVSWIFSQPPWWNFFGFKVYMPSFFLYHLLPMFRAYCRFGILLIFSVSVLAGFGALYLLNKFKSKVMKMTVFVLLCVLVIFDFWNNPAKHYLDLGWYPSAYDWLKKQDKDMVIAEYPMDIIGPNDFYKFFQTIHEKKMVNGSTPGTPAHAFAKSIARLSDDKTTALLNKIGVRYVLVHRNDYLETELSDEADELERISKNQSLKLIHSYPGIACGKDKGICLQETGPIDLYEVLGISKR